jgi:hypothetical protein
MKPAAQSLSLLQLVLHEARGAVADCEAAGTFAERRGKARPQRRHTLARRLRAQRRGSAACEQ